MSMQYKHFALIQWRLLHCTMIHHNHYVHKSRIQVCLISQSWDNVVSIVCMHDHLFLTVHAHKTQRRSSCINSTYFKFRDSNQSRGVAAVADLEFAEGGFCFRLAREPRAKF